MHLHDVIVAEFESTKSLAALIYIIDHGRELEFSLYQRKYFISRDTSKKYVSIWEGENEQAFDSMEELLTNAVISDTALLSVWQKIQIIAIF